MTIRHGALQLQPDIKAVVLTKEYFAEKYQATLQQVEEMQAKVCLVATGVPFFIFDMKCGIFGAQPLETFHQTVESAWADEAIGPRE